MSYYFDRCKAIPIKCFVSHRPVSCDGGSVDREKKEKKKKKTLEGVWVAEKAGLLSKKAWLQSQLEGVVFSTNVYTAFNMLKNVVWMLIKDKDTTSCQLLLIKQDRMLVN